MTISSFGAEVRRRRRALGLTQADLARQVGCATATIRKLEYDERRPSLQMAERLARYLEVADDDLAAFLRAARVEDVVDAVAVPNNLPPTPALFGRDDLVVSARNRLLRSKARLLTMVGPGGVGKTSLALRTAVEVAPDFPDGVYLVALAAIEQSDQLLATIANALGAADQTEQSDLERLRTAIDQRRMLLVLDNLEQIVGAGAVLTSLLAACPTIVVLATSRSALHIRGEQVLTVPPLSVVEDTLAESPAVALFLERARRARPDFTPVDIAPIAAICMHLDGLPLAIELVAARSSVVEPAELLRHLQAGNSALELSQHATTQLPARQRSLIDSIGWSMRLLSEQQRIVLLRMGVFPSSFDLAAIEALSPELTPVATLDVLQQLVHAGLLTRTTSNTGATRFLMLRTIREYALAELANRQLEVHTRAAHAAYIEQFAAEADAHLADSDASIWAARLDQEQEHIRAALDWALAAAPAVAARLGHYLWWYWYVQGHWREGRRWINRMLAQPFEVAPSIEADLYKGGATLAKELSDYQQAERWYQRALDIYSHANDLAGRASTLNNLGGLYHRQGRAEDAAECYLTSMELVRQLGNRPNLAISLSNLAVLYQEHGRFEEAIAFHQESSQIYRELDQPIGLAMALTNMGQLALLQHDLASAEEHYRDATVLCEVVDEHRAHATALNGLGMVQFLRGDYAEAKATQRRALQLMHDLGDTQTTVQILECFAHALGAEGDLRAARFYGLGDRLRAELGAPINPSYWRIYEVARQAAADQHSRRAWDAMVLAGRAASLDDAVRVVLET